MFDGLLQTRTRLQPKVQVGDGEHRVDDGFCTEASTCDDFGPHRPVFGGHFGNGGGRHILVARRHHLVFSWKVHPYLETMASSTVSQDVLVRQFAVNDASAGGHPLNVARPKCSAVAGGVLVDHAAVEQVGDRLKAAMGMGRCAHRFARTVVHRAHLVQQQKRAHHGPHGCGTAHEEATAFSDRSRGDGGTDGTCHGLTSETTSMMACTRPIYLQPQVIPWRNSWLVEDASGASKRR